jgi:hypothetical protein
MNARIRITKGVTNRAFPTSLTTLISISRSEFTEHITIHRRERRNHTTHPWNRCFYNAIPKKFKSQHNEPWVYINRPRTSHPQDGRLYDLIQRNKPTTLVLSKSPRSPTASHNPANTIAALPSPHKHYPK